MASNAVAWWVHCDIDGSGARWRLAVDRGSEVYFPVEDFGEEMSFNEYREEFPHNEVLACSPDDSAKVLRIAQILNALHNGEHGELTPGQARKEAIKAICDVLGVPF